MTSLIYLVSLNMGLHLCCLESLALLQVWLCSRTSKSLCMGDVLAHIKHRSRRFRYSLNKFYVQPGVSLFKRFGFITPNEWNNFQQLHSSLEAMVDSNRMKELIQKNKFKHRLGPGGYKVAIPL
jgi:hypothetical protein